MADTPTSPLVRLKQRLLPRGLVKSETIRVVAARAKEERVGSGPVKTKGCLSHLVTRSRRPYTTPRQHQVEWSTGTAEVTDSDGGP